MATARRGQNRPPIYKGLHGLTVDETAVSKVMPETNSLTYRGYPVQDLCRDCCFEEVAYLLLNGELPSRARLRAFRRDERARRELSADHLAVIRRFPKSAHPMDTIRSAVSYLGTTEVAWGGEPEKIDRRRAMDLLAKIPTMIAADTATATASAGCGRATTCRWRRISSTCASVRCRRSRWCAPSTSR